MLAISLDGRLAPAEGGAAQLGGSGDRRVLEEALAWADGCLIGAETLRRHGSTCLIRAPDLLEQRLEAGRSPQPVAIAVSRRGDLAPQLPFFTQPIQRWLLREGGPCPGGGEPSQEVAGFERVLDLSAGWPQALARLAGLGLARLAVLGGAILVGSLLAEGLMDELQFTHCPWVLGGSHTWAGPSLAIPLSLRGPWELVEQRALGGGELLLRYRREETRKGAGLESPPG